MKQIVHTLIAIVLLSIPLRPQALPDASGATPRQILPEDPGWKRVASLAHGDEIEINAGRSHTVRCLFSGAIPNKLFCDPEYSWPGRHELRFDKTEVVTVRQRHTLRNRRILVAGMAVASGLAMGIHESSLPTNARVLSGVTAAGLGGLIGYPIAAVASEVIPGDVLYRRR